MTFATKLEASATPPAAVFLLALFSMIVGIWYLIANRRKIRRLWRKLTGRKDFWGYVLAAALFFGFSGFFTFLALRQ